MPKLRDVLKSVKDIATDNAARLVRDLIDRQDLKWFEIGRSGDLAVRKSRKKFHEIEKLTPSLDCGDAAEIEHALMDRFCGHEKYRSHVCDSRGGCPRNGKQYVYVGLVLKKKVKA